MNDNVRKYSFNRPHIVVLLCIGVQLYCIIMSSCCSLNLTKGQIAAGTVIGSLPDEVVHLSFCLSDERVAACSGATAYILSLEVFILPRLNSFLGFEL